MLANDPDLQPILQHQPVAWGRYRKITTQGSRSANESTQNQVSRVIEKKPLKMHRQTSISQRADSTANSAARRYIDLRL